MKVCKLFKIHILICLLLYVKTLAFSQTSFEVLDKKLLVKNFNYAGTSSFPILDISSGGISEGLADNSSLWRYGSFSSANPAISSVINQSYFSLGFRDLFADVFFENFSIAHRIGDLGFGFSTSFLHTDFTLYNYYGSQVNSSNYLETAFNLNFSYNFLRTYYFPGLAFGINLKFANRFFPLTYDLTNTSKNSNKFTLAGDIGVLARLNISALKPLPSREPNLAFSVVAKNIPFISNSKKSSNNGNNGQDNSSNSSVEYSTYVSLNFAASWDVATFLNLSTEFIIPLVNMERLIKDKSIGVSFGALFNILDYVNLYFGLHYLDDNIKITIGSSFKIKGFSIAFNYPIEFGKNYRKLDDFGISLSYDFGDFGRGALQQEVDDLYARALLFYADGKYEESESILNLILKKDKTFTPAKKLLDKNEFEINSRSQLNSIKNS